MRSCDPVWKQEEDFYAVFFKMSDGSINICWTDHLDRHLNYEIFFEKKVKFLLKLSSQQFV